MTETATQDLKSNEAQVDVLQTPDTESQYLTGWKLGITILSLFLGTFLISLDTSIIGVAIPTISTYFHALDDVAWYGTAYLLTITAFQPFFGNIYKFFNVENTFRCCLALFEVGSILCAAASSSKMFIVGRAVAGLGAAGILQGALGVITLIVPLEKRPMYMGIVISVFVISVCVGPVLGGAFTTHSTWRWCFWVNVPIGGVVIALLFFSLRIKGSKNANRSLPFKTKMTYMDPLGGVLFIGCICCLLLALEWGGQTKAWNSSVIIGLFVGFGLTLIAFVLVQWRQGPKAMIPLRVLRQRSIFTGAGVLFFLGAATYVVSFYMPFYFQAVQGIDAVASGVRLIAVFLPEMIALIITGAIVTIWGYYIPYMLLGEAICIIGMVFLTKLHIDTSTVSWAAYLVVQGIGMGVAMQLPYTAVQTVLSEDDVPTGNAIAVFFWQLGGAVAIAIGQTIELSTIVSHTIPGLSAKEIMAWGAANLSELAPNTAALHDLEIVWAIAISRTMIFGLACVCASVPFTAAMEWLNSKKIAEARKKARSEAADSSQSVEKGEN